MITSCQKNFFKFSNRKSFWQKCVSEKNTFVMRKVAFDRLVVVPTSSLLCTFLPASRVFFLLSQGFFHSCIALCIEEQKNNSFDNQATVEKVVKLM